MRLIDIYIEVDGQLIDSHRLIQHETWDIVNDVQMENHALTPQVLNEAVLYRILMESMHQTFDKLINAEDDEQTHTE